MTVKKQERTCDLTIGKKFTINSGNYSSIQPNISLTILDVPFSKLLEMKDAVNSVINTMFIDQVRSYLDEMDIIQRDKIEETFDSVNDSNTKQELDKAIKIINSI